MAVKFFNDTDLGYFVSIIKGELTKYVLKVSGKDLSTNDFTDALKAKLEALEQADWDAVSGGAVILHKPTLGTAASKDVAVSGNASTTQVVMGNDTRLTDARPSSDVTDVYSATSHAPMSGLAVAQAIASVVGLRFESYASFADLPVTGEIGVIYLVPSVNPSTHNAKDEYFWNTTTNAYELFGSTEIDLTDYVKFTDLVAMTQAEVEAVWNSTSGS